MKLKTRLFLGFALLLGIMALFLGISIYSLEIAHTSIEERQQDRYQKFKYSKAVENELNNISRYLRDLAFLNISYDFEDTIDKIRFSREKVDSTLDSLQASAVRDVTKDLLRRIRNENNIYVELQENCISLASAGQIEEFEQVLNEGAVERRQIFKYVEELNNLEDQSMNDVMQASDAAYHRAILYFFVSLILTLLAGVGITFWITRRITGDIRNITDVMNRFSLIQEHIDLPRINIHSNDEIGEIAASFNEMARSLEEHAMRKKEFIKNIEGQNWRKSKFAEITGLCQGVQDLKTLANLLLTKIIPMIEASYGVFYIMDKYEDKRCLKKYAFYAASSLGTAGEVILLGEGLVGQSALENRTIMLDRVPGDYIKITSGLGETSPQAIIVLPMAFEGQVVAVMELASLQPYTPIQLELLELISNSLGTIINRIQAHMKIASLLKESQVLTEELQSQSEELQVQQEELKTFNESLEEHYKNSERRATELEALKAALEEKARELEESSNYKTEFLSNMSHELRTPLNSLLILSQMLTENKEGNLTPNQIEYVKTIFTSGNELLTLINDILDLSKIEAGKVTIHPEVLRLDDMMDYLKEFFGPVAQQKKLDFIIEMGKDLPNTARVDEYRLLQILKNLLSNAFKFTERGSVMLKVRRAENQIVESNDIVKDAEWVMAFSVTDTGIGIPKFKQSMVFEAFQQANGTTSRKYGGTGLGLTISQKLAKLLGGFIDIDSAEGNGSTFTLYLPSIDAAKLVPTISCEEIAATSMESSLSQEADSVPSVSNKECLTEELQNLENANARLEGKKILVVDDDMRNVFALTTALENRNIQTVFAENGREGIEVLQKNSDIDLVLMDIMMPEMDGYEALHRIRRMPEYANLPVIALTAKAMKQDREKCIEAGASDYISKPVNLEQLFTLIKIWLFR